LSIIPRKIKALELVREEGADLFLNWDDGKVKELAPASYVLRDAWSNGELSKLQPFVNRIPVSWGETLTVHSGEDTIVTMRHATTFEPIGRMILRGKDYLQTSLN